MIKYSVPQELVDKLLALRLCQTEQEALEKVASGEATGMLEQVLSVKGCETGCTPCKCQSESSPLKKPAMNTADTDAGIAK